MSDPEPDPLWLVLFLLVGLGFTVAVLAHVSHRSVDATLWDQAALVPLMALGLGHRVRKQGGNVTEFTKGLLDRRRDG